MGGETAEWVSVGVGVGDVEGLGDVELVAVGATLGVGVEVAALLHPASMSASTISAMYLMSSPLWGRWNDAIHTIPEVHPWTCRPPMALVTWLKSPPSPGALIVAAHPLPSMQQPAKAGSGAGG